jgi:hypothetical protein
VNVHGCLTSKRNGFKVDLLIGQGCCIRKDSAERSLLKSPLELCVCQTGSGGFFMQVAKAHRFGRKTSIGQTFDLLHKGILTRTHAFV